MQDHEFEVLKVNASIAPKSVDWPTGDVQVEFMKKEGKPTVSGETWWNALHGAVAEAWDRTLKALGSMAAVDGDKSLSPSGKLEKKRALAEAAIATFEKSGSLDKARFSVNDQLARWNKDLAPPPVDPTVAAEIRAHVMRLKDGDRLPFVTKHIGDAAPAILQGPSFLSGLTPAEADIVRKQYEASRNPEAAEAKAKAMDALQHCEAGFRSAIRTIRDRAGMTLPSNGAAA